MEVNAKTGQASMGHAEREKTPDITRHRLGAVDNAV
jgi:hypothetical protein